MKFRVVSKFDYLIRAMATLLVNARVHCSPAQKIMRERWTTAPNALQELIVSEPDRNRFDRLRVAEDGELKLHYRAEAEVHQQFFNPGTPSQGLPGASRSYAHSLSFTESVLSIGPSGAVRMAKVYETSRHRRLDPPDFHACVEAFIGGHWILFDATRLTPLNGLVRIGLGRDAADVSVCTAFGAVTTARQNVRCELVESGSFRPLTPPDLNETSISLDAGGE